MTQQNPESTRSSSAWLIVLALIALALAAVLLVRACPKPVPAAAPTAAGQTTADAAKQEHEREVAAG